MCDLLINRLHDGLILQIPIIESIHRPRDPRDAETQRYKDSSDEDGLLDGKISALETCEDQNKQVSAGNLWHDCCERNLNYACEGGTAGKSENWQGEGVMKCRLSSIFPLTSPALSFRAYFFAFLTFPRGDFPSTADFLRFPK